MKTKKKIIIISSLAHSLINFRFDLILKFIDKGYKVYCIGPDLNIEVKKRLNEVNAEYIRVPLEKNGFNVFSDVIYIFRLVKIFIKINPNKILSYTIKPVIFSNIAVNLCNILRNKKIKSFSLITGLGFYGSLTRNFRGKLIETLITLLYKITFKSISGIAFQNNDDIEFIKSKGIKLKNNRIIVTSGSGVNLERFSFSPIKNDINHINFLQISRLLKSKGVEEFLFAAEILKKKYFDNVSFTLIGMKDQESPDSIDLELLKSSLSDENIEYFENIDDVRPFLKKSSIFVLPSYYREGIPRTLIEALAVGRGIITTENVGCKEVILEGKNGFKIQPKKISSLADKMSFFVENKSFIKSFSFESRKYAEQRFDVDIINNDLMKLIENDL